MSRYLTVEQVADVLGVSVSWVYKHKELLGGVRLGERLWRFPEQDLAARLTNRAEPSTPPEAGADRNIETRPAPAPRRWRLS